MIAYHGTNREAAASIHKDGFRVETWFARELLSAILYGGKCIFMVEFSDDPSMWHGERWEDDWQFHLGMRYGPEHIVGYTIYTENL